MKEIKLKEIKPKTAIHCTDKEQIECLIKNNIVGNWALEREIPIWLIAHTENKVANSWMPEIRNNGRTGKKYCKKHGYTCVEFSDLILPELSAEEVLEIRNKLEFDFVREYLGLAYGPSLDEMLRKATVEQVMDMCERWKATQEKKKPETEWVDVCRIIQIHENGTKKCVYEEEIKPDEDLPYGSEKLETERIFKKYISEHGGKFIAVVEPICRVKGE